VRRTDTPARFARRGQRPHHRRGSSGHPERPGRTDYRSRLITKSAAAVSAACSSEPRSGSIADGRRSRRRGRDPSRSPAAQFAQLRRDRPTASSSTSPRSMSRLRRSRSPPSPSRPAGGSAAASRSLPQVAARALPSGRVGEIVERVVDDLEGHARCCRNGPGPRRAPAPRRRGGAAAAAAAIRLAVLRADHGQVGLLEMSRGCASAAAGPRRRSCRACSGREC